MPFEGENISLPSMKYTLRPLTAADEPLLWEMLYQGVQPKEGNPPAPSREIVHQPQLARYVEGWGRSGDTGFVAHDVEQGQLLGAVWLRRPADQPQPGAPLELAFAVKPGQRGRGIGTALLTQLVRANPEASAITISSVAGHPVLRLYERFGFKAVEQKPNAIVMRRE